MIERDMEDLIASYPDEFFGRKQFVLVGRQKSFAGVGRFDLLFEDEFKSAILVELKARTLKYEDATQVAKYRDELKRDGQINIVMWLVAPQIPHSVREFLDDKGIEYSEIHLAEFRRVADRHGFTIKSEVEAETRLPSRPQLADRAGRQSGNQKRRAASPAAVATGPEVTSQSVLHWKAVGCDLALENPEDFDAKKFLSCVDAFASAVRSAKNKSLVDNLKTWAADARHAQLASATVESLLRWTITGTTWQAAVPFAFDVWTFLFGTPVPTWKTWNDSERRYEFDAEAWRRWFESLGQPATVQA